MKDKIMIALVAGSWWQFVRGPLSSEAIASTSAQVASHGGGTDAWTPWPASPTRAAGSIASPPPPSPTSPGSWRPNISRASRCDHCSDTPSGSGKRNTLTPS